MPKGSTHETPLFRCNSCHPTYLILLLHRKVYLVGSVCHTTQWYIRTDIFPKGNSIYAAITAICAANLVLVAYIILSVMEDRQSFKEAEEKKLPESKKQR